MYFSTQIGTKVIKIFKCAILKQMVKSKTETLKKILLAFFGVIFSGIVFIFFLFVYETKNVKLDTSLFASSKNTVAFSICDASGKSVDMSFFSGEKTLDISTLPSYVKNAFISIEDKRFYSHAGVDFKRIVGASLRNIKNKKFSEGASTITQQLIKNTHLSREKTIKRKLQEIKLSVQAERVFSKDKILEEYLNTIYFGNGAYGIENASNLYFSKQAKDLTLTEGAVLAGVINAPRIYDPILNPENCLSRRNLVLSLMKNQGHISEDEYQKNAKLPLNIVKNDLKTMKIAKKCIINEVCDKLKISENQLKNMQINIKCNLDFSLQNQIDLLVQNPNFHVNGVKGKPASIGVFVVENKTKNVVAVSSFNGANVLSKRQPGSVIKPIIVYAPAIENGLISPETILKDEPISFDGYSPSNASKTYSGNVSARYALEKSLNIPAVKVLSNLGVNKAKNFASNLGIDFSQSDNNLALALGGMTNGISLKQIADAYSAFASNGEFSQSDFVSEITTNNGQILYSKDNNVSKSMKESTAYLITDMLKGVVKNGTARRLSGIGYEVCAKTGTVGVPGSSFNSDAYLVCYTSEHTVVCYYGATTKSGNLPANVNGATYPASLSKQVLNCLYNASPPQNFERPVDVVTEQIDTRDLESGKVLLALPSTKDRYKRSAIFDKDNLPPYSSEVDIVVPTLEIKMAENKKPILMFDTQTNITYKLVRTYCGKQKIIYEIKGGSGKAIYEDSSTIKGEIYEYKLELRSDISPMATQTSNTIKLMSF